jgi:hypothetical protein
MMNYNIPDRQTILRPKIFYFTWSVGTDGENIYKMFSISCHQPIVCIAGQAQGRTGQGGGGGRGGRTGHGVGPREHQ